MDPLADDPLHLVGRFDDPHTGAERSLPDLAALLQGRRATRLWSDVPVHPVFAARGVRQIQAGEGEFPQGGSLLIGGVHVQLGRWLEQALPRRLLLRYNLPNHLKLFEAITRIRAATGLEPELLFVSKMLQVSVGLRGQVEPSLIRLDDFLGIPLARPAGQPVVVGRLSRDVVGKHDPQDVALYRLLAARGIRVRIMGGTCLRPWLGQVDGVELLPAGAEQTVPFLRSLNVFVYRTGSFVEPYGRVVLEAMASGLPVVASASGGYAEQIVSGTEGFVVQTQEEALQCLMRLAASPKLRQQIGEAARRKAITVHGPQAIEALLRGYLA